MAKRSRRGKRLAKGRASHASRRRDPVPFKPVITIRALDGADLREADVTRPAELERLAREWGYILRARSRWTDDDDLRQTFSERARDDLERAGITRTFIRQLASATHVEVELRRKKSTNESDGRIFEAASEIPWEYLLSAATRAEGRFQSFLITRLFHNNAPANSRRLPRRLLFVESAPGRLEDRYEFGSERVRIRAAMGADGTHDDNMDILETPLLSELHEKTLNGQWNAMHVTGIDTQQAIRYIPDIYDKPANTDASGRIPDGMILRDRNIAELPVRYDTLASALVNPQKPPGVVTLNLYHSGARTARELVARGAHAALGFLDEIDDELAERFFQAFYSAWYADGNPSIPGAFAAAWRAMNDDRLYGTGIVIWMGRSELENFRTSLQAETTSSEPPESRQKKLDRLNAVPIDKLLQVDFDVDVDINYSLLHNDRPLLTKLTLNNLSKASLENITVQVELNVGSETYPYRYTCLALDEVQLDLAPMVKIPLTANVPRSLRERVQSTVYVKVTCCERTAYEDTRRVTLTPVDEWLDDTVNNPWLPSFVLPRDRAVQKIIASSRRYLIGIADDPGAGFDGYQSEDVDLQVQAIWTALVNDYRLQYINPPPAYSKQTQRLRTPSEILTSNSGTCIDLALLLASCLEYVDIYPVVVLLSDHAFVGYWRSEKAYGDFVEVKRIPVGVPAVGSLKARKSLGRSADDWEQIPAYVDEYGWRLTPLHYDEMMAYVTAGDLVMLEATFLTGAYGFADAIEEGRANLRSRKEFDSLLDIGLGRAAGPPVTPLPVVNE